MTQEESSFDKVRIQSEKLQRNKKASASLQLFRLLLLTTSGLSDQANTALARKFQLNTIVYASLRVEPLTTHTAVHGLSHPLLCLWEAPRVFRSMLEQGKFA